jgi:microcin C transport system ATP-binding protein
MMDAIANPLLRVRDLSVAFHQGGHTTVAVDHVSFDIVKGETLALVGESGSGKSVTALSVMKLLPYPSASHPSGAITFKGQELLALPERDMRKVRGNNITIVFQEPMTSLNPLHTIEQQIEPTTALDVTVQAQILQLLRDIQGRLGMAMLFITHDLGIVRKIADRVCVMKHGKIVEHGKVEDVFSAPQHPYTRELMAAEPKGKPPAPNPAGDVMVSTDDLKVWFPIKRGLLRNVVGHIKAVDGVSVKVHRGETLGVVGESGSGKTTLGLAILRLIASQGPIVFMGKELQGLKFKAMRPHRRDMQIVFQDPYGSLSPRMSVSDVIEEGLWVHQPHLSEAEREQRVVRALTDVGLDPDTRFRYPHEFSGGQRQRIAVARAIVLEPTFVVLDEPTSALDMLIQAQIVDLLRDLQARKHLTYMFISHDLKVVAALASRLIVMRNGKVVEEGTAAEVFAHPKSDYTRALFAAAFNLETAGEGVVAQ